MGRMDDNSELIIALAALLTVTPKGQLSAAKIIHAIDEAGFAIVKNYAKPVEEVDG